MRRTIVALLVLLAAAVPLLAQGTFTQIDYPGSLSTSVRGINTAGDIVGAFTDTNNSTHGFLLSGDVYTRLDFPGTTNGTVAYGINDVGQIVGAGGNDLWVYDIQTETYAAYTYGVKYVGFTGAAINNAGSAVGWVAKQPTYQHLGITLRNSVLHKYTIPGTYSTSLISINSRNEIIGSTLTQGGFETTWVIKGRNYRNFHIGNIPSATARAINDNGLIAGNYVPEHVGHRAAAAFEYQNGILTPVFVPGSLGTYAIGINNSRQLVGYFVDASNIVHGYIWTPPADAVPNRAEKTINQVVE